MTLSWDDAQEIASRLAAAHPGVDPLDVSFPTLHRWVTELPDFAADPEAATEGKLEAIQMAWYEEVKP